MKPLSAICSAFALLACLPAQTVEIIGGLNTSALRTNTSKSSLYRVDTTTLVLEFEMWLDVPGVETLTFFSHRHHSRTGTATLDWTHQVVVDGTGVGPAWYSTGPIALPLVAGNHYTLGVAWPGSLTYWYSTATTGAPVSFGSWQRAHTINNPLPPTLVLPAGVDVAQYRQRITSVALPLVNNVGTGCSTLALPPRVVARGLYTVGTSELIELVDAAPSSLGVLAFAGGATVPVPLPLFGCSVWLDLSGPLVTLTVPTDPTGYGSQAFPVPNDPFLAGLQFSVQAVVLNIGLDVSSAMELTTNGAAARRRAARQRGAARSVGADRLRVDCVAAPGCHARTAASLRQERWSGAQ